MFVKLPKLSVLATIADSKTDMYVEPSGHMLFVSIPPDDDILMFIVEENLHLLSEHGINHILQREILLAVT